MRVSSDAARTIAASRTDPGGSLPPLLIVLTAVTGVVDAVSYLQLGHVFVANMTGNVVFLGFALAGAGGVSSATLVALAAFLTGALAGGRLGNRLGAQRERLLTITVALEVALVAAALGAALVGGAHATSAGASVLIVLLALAMGLQSATARRLGVRDLPTTVLTMTLTSLAAESPLAGGRDAAHGRRLAAVAAMLCGAFVGGLLVLHVAVTAALGVAAGLLVLAGLASHRLSSSAASQPRVPS